MIGLHKQPPTLYSLCHVRLCEYLVDKVMQAANPQHKGNSLRQRMRPFLVARIPMRLRCSLLEQAGCLLKQKCFSSPADCHYGRSVLYLLHLLLCNRVTKLKVALCCYGGCRDMEAVLRCIRQNAASLQSLQLSRSSLLRMDPLLFRNVLTAALQLSTLVIQNICSDAMLKLIGSYCPGLAHLDISHSKQVTDAGVEGLCWQVRICERDADDSCLRNDLGAGSEARQHYSMTGPVIREQTWSPSGASRAWWRAVRAAAKRLVPRHNCDLRCAESQVLVQLKAVQHRVCSTLCFLDITGTNVTNTGLLVLLRKLTRVKSLGEYSISDQFLRSLCIAEEDHFSLEDLYSRNVSGVGMCSMVQAFPLIRSLACCEPHFDLANLSAFDGLKEVSLLRIVFTQVAIQQLLGYIDAASGAGAADIERLTLEFVLQEGQPDSQHFDIGLLLRHCRQLKMLSVDFSDVSSVMPVPAITCSSVPRHTYYPLLDTLAVIHLGQVVRSHTIVTLLTLCPNLRQMHCYRCPELTDEQLRDALGCAVASSGLRCLECFYIYDAVHLSEQSFPTLLRRLPALARLGNLARWAVGCDGMSHVLHTIRDNNLSLELLTGSHWFSSDSCSPRSTRTRDLRE